MSKIYSLAINGETIVEIDVETPRWLPVRPVLDKVWLRSTVAHALRNYFARREARSPELFAVPE